MASDINLDGLPKWERQVIALCLRLTPSDLDQHRYVWEYLLVGEQWMALELLVAGSPEGLSPDDHALLVDLIEALSYEMWAAPGAAADWITEQQRQSQPNGQ